jgi:hypothetical protein
MKLIIQADNLLLLGDIQMTLSSDQTNHAALFDPESNLVFISGDQDSGLIVTGYADMSCCFDFQGTLVQTTLSVETMQPGVMVISLLIKPEKTARFRVDWLIPDEAINAAMTLNGELLISPFSNIFPAGSILIPQAVCGQTNLTSTLHPGQFQSINFSWQSGDVLRLYLVMQRD